MPTPKLILFDIDATLLVTGGAGIGAMIQAGKDLHRHDFHADGIDFAGRIDPLLIDELMRLNGVEPSSDKRCQFRTRYADRLAAMIPSSPGLRALPGVLPLLDALPLTGLAHLGLLTGNFAETGHMKLRACGIDPVRFSAATAWGDDSPHDPPRRDHLPPVAMRRFHAAHGVPIAPHSVIIIGDTPHDVQCAKTNGCRSLGVATGKFSIAQLREAGADVVLPDLSRTDEVVAHLHAR